MLIPEMLCDLYAHWIGSRNAIDTIFNARLMHAGDAKTIGLVNEVCEVEEVLPNAEERMQEWLRCYPPVLQKTKEYLKRDLVAKMDRGLDDMLEQAKKLAQDPQYMAHVANFAMRFAKK